MKFAISNIVRIFANEYLRYGKKERLYCYAEQLARFAKALGHPARIAIMHFLAKQKTCYFLGIFTKNFPLPKQPYHST